MSFRSSENLQRYEMVRYQLQYRLKVWTHQVAAKPSLCRVLPPRVHRG